jgi:hypothetical protein
VVISGMSHLFPVNTKSAVCHDMVRNTLEQRVFPYDTYVKYNLLESVGEKFDVNFVMKEFPADKQFIIW